MSLSAPKEVAELAARLRAAGYEAWCVGGAVRDALLGTHRPGLPELVAEDWDLATSATPQQVQKLFRRTVPVGIEFGTVGVFDSANVMHEVTTFRRDVKTDGRHAVVEFGVSLDDDLARRDFTINAIAFDPATGELRDPFDGRTDLKRGLVRAVGAAAERMKEDRLRALRGIRFAARFHFHIEPETWAAIRASAPHMNLLSAERVKQELEKTMQQVEMPSVALEWWRESGALAALVPGIANAPTERFKALDVLPRGGNDDAKGATLNRLAMLFFGESPTVVERATKGLKFSNTDSAWIVELARARAAVGSAVDAALAGPDARTASPGEIRRWVAQVGRMRTSAFCTLTAALLQARTSRRDGPEGALAVDEEVARRLLAFGKTAVEIAFRDPIEIADLAIDGEDLAAIGVKPGPAMGRILKQLLERVVDDPALNTLASLAELARAGDK